MHGAETVVLLLTVVTFVVVVGGGGCHCVDIIVDVVPFVFYDIFGLSICNTLVRSSSLNGTTVYGKRRC